MGRTLAILAVLLAASMQMPRIARAQIAPGVGSDTAAADIDSPGLEAAQERPKWEVGPARTFVQAAVDVGYLYFRPRFGAGYGQPHWRWFGIEGNPIISGEGFGAYSGLRASIPLADIRLGGRYFFSFQNSYLTPRNEYDRIDVEDRSLDKAQYLSLEAEVTTTLGLGPGTILGVFTGTYVTGVPDDNYVFEQTIRVVVDPPWVWRARTGYILKLGAQGEVGLGPVFEVVGIPGRDMFVYRGGLVASMRLWEDLEVRGTVVPVLWSQDSLGAAGGDSFQLGIRYRWATGPFSEPVRRQNADDDSAPRTPYAASASTYTDLL